MWETTDSNTITYGLKDSPIVLFSDVESKLSGTRFSISYNTRQYSIQTSLTGSFNAYNAAAAFCTGICLGIEPETIINGIGSVTAVPGRLESISGVDDIKVFIDYSHTPDSLEKALKNLRQIAGKEKTLKVVFGCGGDRDAGKRPIMGRIATINADYVIITNDNPRSENPANIIQGIVSGIESNNYEIVEDRREAIIRAIETSVPGTVLLIAGKGHESYQIIGKSIYHFNDAEIVRDVIEQMQSGREI
jgi:UDP-N-acetylmuramoyl-L-alanyl-D-glutamate--2,6-diaminopimelate ligase